jgi:hypothetical protein
MDASDLMPVYREHGLASLRAPGSLLMLEWSAPLGCDGGDPQMWRLASPHWTEARAELVAEKRAKATSPAAVAAFESQWLNQWRPVDEVVDEDAGRLVPAAAWDALAVRTRTPWTVAAIEVSVNAPPVVALAGVQPDGRVLVSVRQASSVSEAARMCPDGVRVLAGKSLCVDPALAGLAEPRVGVVSACLSGFHRMVFDGVVVHDGGDLLGGQLLDVRVTQSTTGPRVVTSGRVDAIKAAFWAVESARDTESPGVF